MRTRFGLLLPGLVVLLGSLVGCAAPLPWPGSPLYEFPPVEADADYPRTLDEAMAAIEGAYAHFDVVAYEDSTTATPMRTLIVSYGFTEFRIEDGALIQIDRFCHADQFINQTGVEVLFSDEATQAIRPRTQAVDLTFRDGLWHMYRPATPTLLGIEGDASMPLSTDPDDPNLIDPDGDGNPGVTVRIRMGIFLDGEIYITRREIYENHMFLHPNGYVYGHVVDRSEQFVVGASQAILMQPSNQVQLADPGMNPIILVPIDESATGCEDLRANAGRLFPEPPSF